MAETECAVFHIGTAFCCWCIRTMPQRNSETAQSLLQIGRCQAQGKFRCLVKPVGKTLHIDRIHLAVEGFVGNGEDLPDLVVERTFFVGPLCAYGGVFRIAVIEQILRRKDIGALTRRRCLAIGGKLREEIVVVGLSLRPCEEIIKKPLCMFIIVPEYAEIVAHHISFPFKTVRRTTPGVRRASQARTPRYSRSRGRSHGHAGKRIPAARHCPRHSSRRAHGRAGRSPHVHL